MIRRATPLDADRIAEIWKAGAATNNASQRQLEQVRCAAQQSTSPFGYWVSDHDGTITAWCSLNPMRSNPEFREAMAELSLFVCPVHRGRGAGLRLTQAALTSCSGGPIRNVFAWISEENTATQKLACHTGATKWATSEFDQLGDAQAKSLWMWKIPRASLQDQRGS